MTEETTESQEETESQQEDLAEDVLNALDATHQSGKTVYTETAVINNIRRGLKKTVEGILLAGKWLEIARSKGGPCYQMTTDGWDAWLKKNVSLTKGEASKYMAIWANPVFRSVSDLKQFDQLPTSYTVLYALASATKDSKQGIALLQQLLDAGELHNVNTDAAAEIVRKLKGKTTTPQVTGKPSATVLKAKLDKTEHDLFTVSEELDQAIAHRDKVIEELDTIRNNPGVMLGELISKTEVSELAKAINTLPGERKQELIGLIT